MFPTMTPLRLRNAVQQLHRRNSTRRLGTRSSLVTAIQPQTAPSLAERVQTVQSRVTRTRLTQRERVVLYRSFSARSKYPRSSSFDTLQEPALQSAFPKKTFIALCLGTAFAYFFIEVREEQWTDVVTQSRTDKAATPLHFYKDRDAVDLAIRNTMDPSNMLKEPMFLHGMYDAFAAMGNGWEMNEDDASEANMPVTHGCQFSSNEPCEDTFAIGTAPGPGSNPWNYWSICDGHAGRHTAMHLQWHLHPTLSRALSNLSPTSPSSTILATIKQTFLQIDADLMNRARLAANWHPAANASALMALAPALSGSCALLAAFDPQTDKLRVAIVGDSRAVLGRWDVQEGKYVAQPLSIDQTGFNASEVERITAAHPDEPDILDPKSGRLLGIAVTRAFGDHRWKWDNDFIKQVQYKFWGTAPRPNSKTPPYMDAEPEITETDIVRVDPTASPESGKSDFMIMASDGLWDHISSDHAVQCVESWLEARARGNGRVADDPQLVRPLLSNSLQLDPGVDVDPANAKEITWKATPEYFAIEDDNAAVCLARNAMGGTRRGLFMGLFTIPGPFSRDAVDDTTIMVVFFDKVAEGGKKKKEKRGRVLDEDGGARKKVGVWWPFGGGK